MCPVSASSNSKYAVVCSFHVRLGAGGAWWRVAYPGEHRGLYGRVFYLVRESQAAASCLGIDVSALRFGAFILSAAYGGAAGALMAHVIRVVSPKIWNYR